MKKCLLSSALFFALLSATFAAPVDADSAEAEPQWSGGVELTGTNNYLWRGMTVNEAAILQPTAWLTHRGVTLSLWSSWTLSEPKDDIKRHEIDAAITYTFELAKLAFETYFNYYHYLDQPDAPNTGEVACIVGYPLGIVTLKAGVMCDVMEYSGAVYTEQGVEVEKELNDRFTFFGGLGLGSAFKKFNEAYFELPHSTTSLISLEGRLTYTAANGLYLQPYFQYNKTLNNELKAYLKKHASSFGLLVGKEF
ncbi:hypothetical protein GX408_18240 [bacterium]|nr:hypothetical protein [bacterium]